MIQLLNSRSDPLKETQSDILQMNVTNSVLTDNKNLDSDFKEIDFSREKKHLLKNTCFDKQKTEHMQRLCQVQNIFVAKLLRMPKRLEREQKIFMAKLLGMSRRLEKVL